MASNLTAPGAQHRRGDHRDRARRPVAQDHGRREGRDPRAQEHHQHDGRPAQRVRVEVTRVAREVGTEGKLGGQAHVPGVAGTWKDLTDNVNSMAGNLTAQVATSPRSTTAVARGDLSRKITVDVQGEILELKRRSTRWSTSCDSFASEVTRVAREVGTEGKLGGQAQRAGRRRHLEGSHGQRERRWPANLTTQVRNIARGHHRGRARRPLAQDHGRRQRRDPRAQEHDQHRRRPAELVRGRGHARCARGRHRGQARRPSSGARRRGHVEGPHRQRERRWPRTSRARCAASRRS